MKTKKPKLSKAVKTLTKALKNDVDFFRAYKDNIAMQFKDEYSRVKKSKRYGYINNSDVHKIANTAAHNFLELLIGFENLQKSKKYTRDKMYKGDAVGELPN